MTIVDFENVKVTTMTVIVDIIGNVIIEAAFPLLPISRMNLENISISSKKFKIPWPGPKYAGSIFSTKFSGITRGIIKSSKGKSFRNSIGIDICTSSKNISAKLSKNKIHMCGPNSEKLALETAQHILNHLIRIQEELDHIHEHLSDVDEVIRWLIKETKGESYIINEETQEIIELEGGESIRNSVIYDKDKNIKYAYHEIPFVWEEGDMINGDDIVVNKYGQPYFRSLSKKERREGLIDYPVMRVDDVMKLKKIDDKFILMDDKGNKYNKVCRFPIRVLEINSVKYPQDIPKHIDSRIANFFISYIQDYAYHHVFKDFLKNIKEIDRVYYCEEENLEEPSSQPFQNVDLQKIPLSLGELNIAMINYSYSIQMNVDRWTLTKLIDGYEKNGKIWRAVYNNTTDHHVTITVPYTADADETIKRKESKSISWMVYKSGIVTQSGPSPKLMREVYYDFMNFIESVRDLIRLKDDKPFSIKFKPV